MTKALKFLVIHCTATPEGREVTVADIRKWHLSKKPVGRGWSQVGYTDLIHIDGTISNLVKNNDDAWVDPWEITNGVAGINSESQHIVYAGGMDKLCKEAKDTRNIMQIESMTKFVKDFIKKHPTIKIGGHNQFDAKACPSFNVPSWLKSIGVSNVNIYKP